MKHIAALNTGQFLSILYISMSASREGEEEKAPTFGTLPRFTDRCFTAWKKVGDNEQCY